MKKILKKNNKEVEEKLESKNKKEIYKRIFNIIFCVIIFILFLIWTFDFIKVRHQKQPSFCIKNNVYELEDGTVEECIGLGYKVYNYDSKNVNVKTEFGPVFIKMKK